VASDHAWLLVYDGQCAFCERCVALVQRWDRGGRVRAVPLQHTEAWQGTPGLTRSGLEQAMHLVSPRGQVFAGAGAAAPLLRVLPGGRILAAGLEIPFVRRAAAVVYAWVARHRHRLGCASPVCHRGD